MSARLCSWVFSILVLSLVAPLQAQFDGGAVSGTGFVDIQRAPELMRMEILVQTKAGTTEESLQKLNERLEVARSALKALGANLDSIKTSEPTMLSSENDQQRQMQIRALEQMRAQHQAGGRPAKITLPPSVTLSSTVRAEWQLKGSTPDELLVEVADLQQRIRDVDLAGTAEGLNVTPEEQQINEELEQFGYDSFDEQYQPGQPAFSFASKISEDEYTKSLAEAFKKAKQRASMLATAAGAQLGDLRSLTDLSQSMDTSDEDNWANYAGRWAAYYAAQYGVTTQSNSNEPEAVGNQPTKVTYRISVTATFGLK